MNQLNKPAMLQQLRAELSAQFNLPKAKNAKPGQPFRNDDHIKDLHKLINESKKPS